MDVDATEGDDIYVRFSPFAEAKLAINAQGTFDADVRKGRVGRFGVSFYGTRIETGETVQGAVERLCSSLALGGRKIAVVSGTILRDNRFQVVLDEPPPNHHIVGDDDLTAIPRVGDLESLLEKGICPHPFPKKGLER